MRQIEDRFNHQFHYPWVFLNDQPFSQEFRLLTSGMASGDVEYGLIEKNEWQTPSWIDTEKAQKAMDEMVKNDVIYGGRLSYRLLPPPHSLADGRHMCRYNSGFFFRHPLLIEILLVLASRTGHRFLLTQSHYDPFTFMRENDKVYSFIISLPEYIETIPTLWEKTKQYCREHP